MNTAIVYRHGSLTLGKHTGKVAELWKAYDAIRPEGHAGRMNSLYASPNLAGMVRWTHTSLYHQHRDVFNNLERHEIVIRNPESIYVYDIEVYERTSLNIHCYGEMGNPAYAELNREIMQPYWKTAIKLTEWEQVAAEKDLHPMQWEILLPPEAIVSKRSLSDKELMNAVPEYLMQEMTYLLEASKYQGSAGLMGE